MVRLLYHCKCEKTTFSKRTPEAEGQGLFVVGEAKGFKGSGQMLLGGIEGLKIVGRDREAKDCWER